MSLARGAEQAAGAAGDGTSPSQAKREQPAAIGEGSELESAAWGLGVSEPASESRAQGPGLESASSDPERPRRQTNPGMAEQGIPSKNHGSRGKEPEAPDLCPARQTAGH